MPSSTVNKMTQIYIWLGVVIVIFGIAAYYRSQVNKKTGNVSNMKSEYTKVGTSLSTITGTDPTLTDRIMNYYIASSYNSCCAGDFQDSYVTIGALKETIKHGPRVLDFEIYSVGGKCVVAASPFDNEHLKGTYNSLPIGQVMAAVKEHAFSSHAPNGGDPLFLHFRIKSEREDVYEPLANAIKFNFGSKLMEAEWGYEGRSGSNHSESKSLGFEKLITIIGRVIIIASQKNDNFRKIDNPFYELVNLGSPSLYFNHLRNHDVQYAGSADGLIERNKGCVMLTMPDWSDVNTNPPVMIHQSLGCQMICVNYQNMDKNMKYYLDFFKHYAFVLKPIELRYIVEELDCPPPPDEALSFAGKQYTTEQGVKIIM